MVANNPKPRVLTGIRPQRFVISLSGSCCRCGTKDGQACGTCQDSENTADGSFFNGYFEVTQDAQNPDRYLYTFPGNSPHNAQALELRFNSNSNQPPGFIQVCVFITFGPDADDNPVRPVAWGKVSGSVSEIGVLRRRGTNTLCCWPHKITVSPAPVPDFVAPQPEWMPGDPDDLNHAPFWPSLGFDLMEDGDFAPIRYANGELQLRIKDLGSEAFGIPWGHTRIYSHRLSNSHDYGNGYNWMVHEWPRLVSFKSPLNETPPGATQKNRTGCTIALTRGTRNALWFDETKDSTDETTWEPRFGARHVLKHYPDEHLLKIFAPNGHVWEFYDFTSPCSREFQDLDKAEREKIAPGCLKRHIGPYGEQSQQITMTYKNCQIQNMERSAAGTKETFKYEWKDDQISRVILSRQGAGGKRDVSRANYAYYIDPEDDHGNPGDLKTVQVEFWDGTWKSRPNTLQYYAYYKQSNSTYSQGMLKAVIGPESLHRMRTETGKNPVADGPLREYSDLWINYFTDDANETNERVARHKPRRVESITMNCGGRTQTYEYGFSQGGASPDEWFSQAIESRPDGSHVDVLSDVCGETIAHRLAGNGKSWVHAYQRRSFGRLRWIGTPAGSRWPSLNSNGKVGFVGGLWGKTFTFFNIGNSGFLSDLNVGLGAALAPAGPPVNLPGDEIRDALNHDQIQIHHFEYGHRDLSEIDIWYLQKDENPQCNITFLHMWVPSGLAGRYFTATALPPVPASQHGDNRPTHTRVTFNHFGMPVEIVDERKVVTTTDFHDTLSLPRQITVKSVEGELLTTNITADELGRVTETLGPRHPAVTRPDARSTENVRTATWTIYDDVQGVVISAQGFQRHWNNNELINPVDIAEFDRAGRATRQGSAISRNKHAPRQLKAADFLYFPWCRRSEQFFDTQGRLLRERVYSDIKQGKAATRIYNRYDAMFRPVMVTDPDGTTTLTTYDARSLPTSTSLGAATAVETQKLEKIADFEYDDGKSTGNGNLTKLTQYLGNNSARVADMTYDWRDQLTNRQVEVRDPEQKAVEAFKWDEAGRETEALLETPQLPNARESAQIPQYDSRGQVYRALHVQRSIKGGTGGAPELTMIDLIWRDQSGKVIKHRPSGSLAYTTSTYDSLGRQTRGQLTAPIETMIRGKNTHGEFVLEEMSTNYNANGMATLSSHTNRQISFIPSGGPSNEKWGAEERKTHSEVYYDPLGRLMASVDYGTATPLEGGVSIPIPSDLVLVNRYHYNDRGEVGKVIDPKGRITEFAYNDMGQTVLTSESRARGIRTNYLNDGRVHSIEILDLQTGKSKKVVEYEYGSSKSSGVVLSNAWVTKEIDGEKRNTIFRYNYLGEVTALEDTQGTIHSFLYDEYGRMTDDVVERAGKGIDGSVKRISWKFDARGRQKEIESYRDTEGKVSRVRIQRGFDFSNQLTSEHTEVAGRGVKRLGYRYAGESNRLEDSSAEDVAKKFNTTRLLRMVYPSARHMRFIYGYDLDANIGNSLSRVSALRDYGFDNKEAKNEYVRYLYSGASDIWHIALNRKEIGDTSDSPSWMLFRDLDSLGRIRSLKWTGKSHLDTVLQLEYRHDRHSLKTLRELRTRTGLEYQEKFDYDTLDRLRYFDRTPGDRRNDHDWNSQSWSLDVSGNWNGWVSQGQNNLHQSRQHTQGNQIQAITNLPREPKWADLGYDEAGNLTQGPSPKSPEDKQKIVYDAWNRPVSFDGDAAKLTYDGLGRLVLKETGEDTRRFTYSPDWQLLEEEVTPKEGDKYRYEYVWGVRGLDDLICREKYFSNSKIPIRHFALADANGNVVGVVDEASGLIQSQITYDPYGQPTGQGDFAHLFGGYYYDHQTGLYLVRNRVYHPTLGRWLQKDPAGMVDGTNLYEYCAGNPANFVDPSGAWIESAWDIFSLGLGTASYGYNLQEGNYGWAAVDAIGIAADTAALLLPLVPGGASAAIKAWRAGSTASDAMAAGRAAGSTIRGVDRLSDALKVADIGGNAIQSYDAFQRQDYLGAGLGALGVGVRGVQTGFAINRRLGGANYRWGSLPVRNLSGKGFGRGASRGGFGGKGLYQEPVGMSDDAVRSAYLAEVETLSFKVKLAAHNILTPGRKWVTSSMVRERVRDAAFGRGPFSVTQLDDGRLLFGGSNIRTFLNRQFFHHELIHTSQIIKNPKLWSDFPLRLAHEPVQLLTAHGTIGWPTIGAGALYGYYWWNE